ncbi:MAG TPA: hypothetical protein VD866_23385 [Urbifossiella sp.]|nr:hypothetical protein [Urbifossiella sp.]
MGYDLHVTRAAHWTESEAHPITRDEWLAYIRSDPELTPDPENGDTFVLWTGAGCKPAPWFDWWRGAVTTKNPRRATVTKMLQLASYFGARVQGDEGEFYESPPPDW